MLDRASPATETWTEERVELLKRLWLEGLSSSQIALILANGATRNAVIGKVSRLKLTPRKNPAAAKPTKPKLPKAAKVRSRPAPMLCGDGNTTIKAPTFIENAERAGRLTLLQLTEHTCKWPIGDPLEAGFSFCGEHSEEGKPYCATHSRRAFL